MKRRKPTYQTKASRKRRRLLDALRRLDFHRVLRAERRGGLDRRFDRTHATMTTSKTALDDSPRCTRGTSYAVARAGRANGADDRTRRRGRLIRRPRKRYLDFSAGLVAVNLGHAHAAVAAAIGEQARRSRTRRRVRKRRRARVGARDRRDRAVGEEGARVFFHHGGGEANEDAMKFARAISGRHKISQRTVLSRLGARCGDALGRERRWPNEPGIPGVVHFFAPFPYRSPFHTRDPREEVERAIDHLEDRRQYEGPIQHRGAADRTGRRQQRRHVYPHGYLAGCASSAIGTESCSFSTR